MARLEIALLGAFQVSKEGELVTQFETAPAQALLIYLVMHPEMPFRREVLADLLWPDQPRSEALHALRQTLTRLRRAIEGREPDPPFLQAARQTIQFNPDSDYWLDTDAFTDLTGTVHAHPHRRLGACGTCLQRLTQAADLYRGDLLSGFYLDSLPFQEWLTMEREHFHRQAMETLYHLADCHNQRREYGQAQHYARRQLELEPWREEAHRQLMLALALSGQRSTALVQYETCRHTLSEELGVEPEAETIALYQRIRDGSLRAGETPLHNLPAQLTPFVGRKTELNRIAQQLNAPDCRLLTLVGPGGIGKTRLALQAAGQAFDAFADGVCFVPLAGISSSEFLVPTIGEAIGYPLSGEADPKRQLLNYLQQKEMLLVLDNFEHLLSSPGGNGSGRDLLLEMVKTAPRLKLLVTSRERLNLQAEWLLTLQGLPYPPAETPFGEEAFEAVELFVQGAQRVRPDFALSAEWLEVVRICRLLEGMPLGIELAATWVSIMPCAEIARELSQGLDLLSATLHDVPDRHRSMEAVFDHSWHLLSEPERVVFKKLSVFRGGFDRQAAEQVAGASLATLVALVNKSLLHVVSPGRYDMLEPLKQYAAAKLAESVTPTSSEVRDRHGRYYLSLLQVREKQLQGDVQPQTLEEINAAFNNIQVAWHWAVDQNQFDLVERVCKSLFLFCHIQSRYQTGDALFKYAISPLETLTEVENSPEYGVLGKLLACRGRLLNSWGEHPTARKMLEKSLRICYACDHLGWAAFDLHSLAMVAVAQGEGQQAKQFAQESLNLCQNIDSQWDEAWALFALGSAAYFLGEYAPGQQFAQQSLELHRQLGNRHGEAACLNTLGLIVCGQYESETDEHETDRYGEARGFFEQNLAIRRTIGDRRGEAAALHNLGYIHFKLQHYDQARARFEASLKISKMIDSLTMMAATGMWMGMLALEQQDFPEARRHLAEALKIAHENDALTRVTDVLYRIGDLLQRTGQSAVAVEYLAFVRYHPATDDRVRKEVEELLAELATALPPEILREAQARGRAHTLEELVSNVLLDQK